MDEENSPDMKKAAKHRLRVVHSDALSDDDVADPLSYPATPIAKRNVESARNERINEPFYDHMEGSEALRQALEHVEALLRRDHLIAATERARRNAIDVIQDLLSALRGDLHGTPNHETTKRIDRVAGALRGREPDTLPTVMLLQAIIDESRRFEASGELPDFSTPCPASLDDFMSMWPERWMDLTPDTFIAAAKAWAKVGRPSNSEHWAAVLEAIRSAGLGRRARESLRRQLRTWVAAGLLKP
jgi:hypothetical protein